MLPACSGGSGDGSEGSQADSGSLRAVQDSAPSDCGDCTFELRPIATLGSESDLALLRRFPRHLARDSRGRVYAVVAQRDHEVLIYEADGAQRRVLGAFGEGPGEFRTAFGIAVGPGDSVFLASDRNRMTVFGPEGDLGRTFVLPGALRDNFAVLRGSRVVMPGLVADPEPIPAVIHLLSPEGGVMFSFGEAEPYVMPNGRWSAAHFARLVYAGAGETVWTMPPFVLPRSDPEAPAPALGLTRFRITDGSATDLEIHPPVDALMASDTTSFGGPSQEAIRAAGAEREAMGEPGPVMIETAESPLLPFEPAGMVELQGSDLVLLASRFQNPGWMAGPVEWERTGPGSLLFSEENLPRIYSTSLEVIDPDTGTVLLQRVWPGWGQLLNDGTLAMMTVAPTHILQIELFEVRVPVDELARQR